MDHSLPPLISICIPPVLRRAVEQVAAEQPPVHPAWERVGQHGRHFMLRTSAISDIEELADWAQSWLAEPAEPLDKAHRQAFQNVIARAGRYVHLRPIGKGHVLADGWKPKRSRTIRKADRQKH